jgi:hypothetical protein
MIKYGKLKALKYHAFKLFTIATINCCGQQDTGMVIDEVVCGPRIIEYPFIAFIHDHELTLSWFEVKCSVINNLIVETGGLKKLLKFFNIFLF